MLSDSKNGAGTELERLRIKLVRRCVRVAAETSWVAGIWTGVAVGMVMWGNPALGLYALFCGVALTAVVVVGTRWLQEVACDD